MRMRSCIVLILDEDREDSVKYFEDVFNRLKNLRDITLIVYFIGRGISTVIPRVKEILLSNLNVSIRLYIFNNVDELAKSLCKDLSECIDKTIYIVSGSNHREVVLKSLKEAGISEINIC